MAKKTTGLWRKSGVAGGKYLVQRRDGTVPAWPYFVLGARDPAASEALRAYANAAEKLDFDSKYVADVRELADEFDNFRMKEGEGNPDAVPHRKDDPATVARMVSAEHREEAARMAVADSFRADEVESWPCILELAPK